MSDLKIQGEVSLDASNAEQALGRVEAGGRRMAQTLVQSGKTAEAAVTGLGPAATNAAEEFSRAEQKVIGALQRRVAMVESAGKGERAYQEALLTSRGFDVAKFAPYLDKLDQVDKANKAASSSLGKIGVSAAQTAAALRGVPAQFTDIITSLQGGQSVVTVFLQQGGQLKDMFGGAGAAARALAGYVAGLVSPVALGAAALGVLGFAAHSGAQELRTFQNAATLSGGAAGISASGYGELAKSLQGIAGTRGKAAEALTEIAGSGQLAGQNIRGITEAALVMEKATGQAVSKTAEQFAALAEDPLKASLKLNESTRFLTVGLYEQIKALTEQGKTTEAARLAVDTYAETTRVRAAAVVENVGWMVSAWRGLVGVIKSAGDAAVNAGRQQTTAQQLASVTDQLNKARGGDANRRFSMPWDASESDLVRQQGALQEMLRLETRGAEAAAERARIQKDGLASLEKVNKANEKGLSVQEQINKAIGEYRAHVANVRAADPTNELVSNPKAIASAEKKIREDILKNSGAATTANDYLSAMVQSFKNADKAILDARKDFYTQLDLQAKLGLKSDIDVIEASLGAEEKAWADRKANFAAELAAAGKKKNSLAEQQRITGEASAAEREHFQAVSKLRADALLAEQKYADALEATASKAQNAATSARQQVRIAELDGKQIGVTGAALGALTQARVEDTARQLEAQAVTQDGIDLSGRTGAALREQAQAIRDLARVQGRNESARAVDAYSRSVRESNAALQFELSLMGMAERERNVALEQYRIEIDLRKQILDIEARTAADPAARATLIAQVTADAAIAKANTSSRVMLTEWKDSVKQYDDIFRQGFADMLNRGEDGWKSFTKSLATTFKTTVADQLYRAFLQPITIKVVGQLLGFAGLGGGVGSAASGGGGLLGAVNTASSLNTLYGAGSQLLLGGTAGASTASLIGANAVGAAGGDALGALIMGNGGWAGVGTTTAAAGELGLGLGMGAGELAGGAAAAGGSSIMGALSAVPGGGWAAAAVLAVLGSGIGSGETRSGAQYAIGADGKASLTYQESGGPLSQAAEQAAVEATYKGINETFKALGSTASVASFNAAYGTSEKGRGGVRTGGFLADGTAFGDHGDGDFYNGRFYEDSSTQSPDAATVAANWSTDLLQSTLQAYQKAAENAENKIPEFVTSLLQGKDIEALSKDEATQLLTTIGTQISAVESFRQAVGLLPFKGLADLSFDAASNLIKLSGGIQALGTNMSAYVQGFYSEDERKAQTQTNITKVLAGVGLETPTSNAAFRALVEAQEKLGDSASTQVAALLSVAGAFAELYPILDETAKAAERAQALKDSYEKLFSGLERSVSAQRSVLQESISSLRDVFGVLKSNVRELYAEADPAQSAAEGRSYIDQVLAVARGTGYLPDDSEALSEAIGAARAGLTSAPYATQFEQDRDRLVLAGKLAELQDLTGAQLSYEERQLKGLDETLAYWKQQVEIATGTYEATLSVADAIKAIQEKLFPTASEKPAVVAGGWSAGGGATAAVLDAYAQASLAMMPGYKPSADYVDVPWYGGNVEMQEAERERRRLASIPSFDVGTNIIPRDMLGMVHEGEAIVPKAFNPALQAYGLNNTARLEALVEGLLLQLDAVTNDLAAIKGSSAQLASQFDDVTEGGNSLRTDVMNTPKVVMA